MKRMEVPYFLKTRSAGDEAVFGAMEKTLQLFEVGFTENEISAAFEIRGSEAYPQELADTIFNPDAHKNRPPKRMILPPSDSLDRSRGKMLRTHCTDEPQLLKKPKAKFAEDASRPVGRTRPEARKRNSSSTGR